MSHFFDTPCYESCRVIIKNLKFLGQRLETTGHSQTNQINTELGCARMRCTSPTLWGCNLGKQGLRALRRDWKQQCGVLHVEQCRTSYGSCHSPRGCRSVASGRLAFPAQPCHHGWKPLQCLSTGQEQQKKVSKKRRWARRKGEQGPMSELTYRWARTANTPWYG